MNLAGKLIQAVGEAFSEGVALHPRRLFSLVLLLRRRLRLQAGADVALTDKTNQPTLCRQISSQFEGKHQIPFTATAEEKRHGRDTRWELRAKEAPDRIKESWPGSAWIVALITTKTTRKGASSVRHLFITSIRTTSEALLRLIRQRWSIENEWHWARDTQLGEDAHRYANRIGAPVFSLLRTVVMNLLRRGGYRSIRRGLRALSHDIKGMLALGGIQLSKNGT